MSVGAIQNATIARVQDFSTIKQNEDNKGYINQVNIGQDMEEDNQQKARQVRSGEEADWKNKKQDAREKGSNEYRGDGGRRRKGAAPSEQMVIKERPRQSFDMKV